MSSPKPPRSIQRACPAMSWACAGLPLVRCCWWTCSACSTSARRAGPSQFGTASSPLRSEPLAPPTRPEPFDLSSSDVAFEDRGLSEPRQPLADRSGAGVTDPFDQLQVVDGGGQQLLQATEVLDEPV